MLIYLLDWPLFGKYFQIFKIYIRGKQFLDFLRLIPYQPISCHWSEAALVFLWKGVLKICHKHTGEHPCQSAISVKLKSNIIEITLRRGCSPVNLLHTYRIPFPKKTSEQVFLIGVFLYPLTTQKTPSEN